MPKLAACRLQDEAKRLRDDAKKAKTAGARDEMIEIAFEYERLAARIKKLEIGRARAIKPLSHNPNTL